MTAKSTDCLICNSKIGQSSRNSVEIFNENSKTGTEKPVLETIRSILEKNIVEKTCHSGLLCKKCYKLLNEYDALEARLSEIKQQIHHNYNTTASNKLPVIKKLEEECNDHDYLDNIEHDLVEPEGGGEGDPAEEEEEEEKENYIDEQRLEEETPYQYVSIKTNNIEKQDLPQEEEEEVKIVEYLQDDFQEENVDDPPPIIVNNYNVKNNEKDNYILPDKEMIGQINVVETDKLLENPKNPVRRKRKDIKIVPGIEHPQEPIISKDGAIFTCLLCPEDKEKVTGDAKNIATHMRIIHEARVYICDVCGVDFRRRNELIAHVEQHIENDEGDFQCEVCNRVFNNLRLFRIHKRIHYPQTKSWPCETCGKRYSSKNLLDEHMNIHIGKRPYKCDVCDKDFASKYTFRAHAKTHEVRARPFECSKCEKTFLSQQNLTQHEKTHLGVKDFICAECGKAFGSIHNLEVHKIVHTGKKPFKCRICSKAFARKAEIRDHERTHTGEKPYQCEFCGSTFSQRSNLQSHKRATHYNDKRYKCDECNKGFKRRRLLDYHIKAVHTGERPFKCDQCDATFVYPEHWKKHLRIHTGEKPYDCEVCGKSFNSRDNRNAHRFTHSEKKPYECVDCSAGFMRKPMLYAHMEEMNHLNDTIIVNQPKLTTQPDNTQQIVLAEGGVEFIMEGTSEPMYGEDELYEIKDHHIILQDNGEHIYQALTTEDNQDDDDDDQMEFVEQKPGLVDEAGTVYNYHQVEGGEAYIVPATTTEYKNILADGQNQVRLVQIQMQSSDTKGWLSLVPQPQET